jgi:hypothetical protein
MGVGLIFKCLGILFRPLPSCYRIDYARYICMAHYVAYYKHRTSVSEFISFIDDAEQID